MNISNNFFSKLFDNLYPINRSIMGSGYLKSYNILKKYINFKSIYFKSGKKVFDWVVPNEWVIKDGYIITPRNKKICKYKDNNLHIMGYSKKVSKSLNLTNLRKILNSKKKLLNAIPYTTSYYKPNYGFNISQVQKNKLKNGNYKIFIDSYFKKGKIIVGEKKLKGKLNKDFLVSSYLCHPSMANNELSGPLVLLGLFMKLKKWKNRNFNYRFVINPETIGSICYLYKNKNNIKKRLAGGLVLTCLGGPKKKLSFKKTRNDNSEINKFFNYLSSKKKCLVREYTPLTGSDERQYCSPGFDLPVGQIARTIYLDYNEYHTSLDNKKFMSINKLRKSIMEIENFLKIFDKFSGKIIRKKKYSEIFLQKYNLYKDKRNNLLTKTIIYLLGHADDKTYIIDIINKYNLNINIVEKAIIVLKNKKLIEVVH